MSFYFAYGSNMNPARMRSRGLAFSEALAGRLEGYALCFDKRAHDRPGRSYANIRHQQGGVVEGVLYRLTHEDEIWKMDPFEGTPIFYSRERMPIITAHGVQPAWVYVANPAMREDGLWPTRSYLEHLLAGRDYLTPAYWEALAAVPAHPDD
ncbi:gamma-glutamylcyclotransferase family protein [Pseudomonas sp. CR3202]|uniref:gamma-glutamylcyclotransferase family protein n=1 Tax=Pseudomonas sp. CR3202 TaxID=3351532 RepID=UPI003BEFBA02